MVVVVKKEDQVDGLEEGMPVQVVAREGTAIVVGNGIGAAAVAAVAEVMAGPTVAGVRSQRRSRRLINV